MRVSAASLLTAVAVSSLIGGGSAAAPKPLMEVNNLVASPAQVEHVDSRHADVRDGISRRSELRRRVFVSTLVVALSSLAVVYLVVQCTRFLSKLNSAPFGQQRLLADGGVGPSCGEGAAGGEEETRLPADLLPSSLEGRVDLQRALLQVTEEDRITLPQQDLLYILDAQKMLREAEDRVGVARQRLVEVEQQITRYHHDVLYPGVTPLTSDLATLGKLEERKQALQQRFNQENAFLSSIAYQPLQTRRAFLKYAISQASGTPLPERLAETLAAAERVLNPGKVFSGVPTTPETYALIMLSDKLRQEVEDLADMVIGVRELPQGMDSSSVRSQAEARAVYMSMFAKKLRNVGMPETSAQVQSSVGILRDALIKTPVQPPSPSALEQGMAALSLEEVEELKNEVRNVKCDENILLSTSKEASKAAAAPTPADDEGWMEIHKRLVDLATTYVMWSDRTVSPNVPEDVKNAYAVAVKMCQDALQELGQTLTPFWKRKTQEVDSQLNESLTAVLEAEKNLVGVLPEGDAEESPVMDVARNCRTRMIAAAEWTNQLDPLEKAHPFVSKIIGQELSHLKSTFASSDESVVRLLDRHAEALAVTASKELGRVQSYLPGQLPYGDGLGMEDFVKVGRQDIQAIRKIIEDPAKTLNFLEANINALEKALEAHLFPARQTGGSLRRKPSTRLSRKGSFFRKK
ncbi:hypothetical protein Emed_006709 [Eimeria media]